MRTASYVLITLVATWGLQIIFASDFNANGFTLSTQKSRVMDLEFWQNYLKSSVTGETLFNLLRHPNDFKSAKPFPHTVISFAFPRPVMKAMNMEINDHTESLDGCVIGSECFNDNINQKSHNIFRSVESFGPASDAVFRFMLSTVFVQYIERITGIGPLQVGENHKDGGVHQTLVTGFEKIHTDLTLDKVRGLHRRVSVFLYLNPDWKDEYGGHLELWSRDLQTCEARISPNLGKLVIMTSDDFSFHGHQTPLACPPTRSMRMLSVHYYTRGRPSSECLNNNCFAMHRERFLNTSCASCSDKCFTPTA